VPPPSGGITDVPTQSWRTVTDYAPAAWPFVRARAGCLAAATDRREHAV
jgi:hypothetical protein